MAPCPKGLKVKLYIFLTSTLKGVNGQFNASFCLYIQEETLWYSLNEPQSCSGSAGSRSKAFLLIKLAVLAQLTWWTWRLCPWLKRRDSEIPTRNQMPACFIVDSRVVTNALLWCWIQYFPDCCFGSSGGFDSCPVAMGQLGNRWSSCHCPGLQPARSWHNVQGESLINYIKLVNCGLTGCQTMWSCRWLPVIQKNIIAPIMKVVLPRKYRWYIPLKCW